MLQTRPVVLMILDGWGIGAPDDPCNAVAQARTPHLDLLEELYPATRLACSGEAVGLPEETASVIAFTAVLDSTASPITVNTSRTPKAANSIT